MFAVCFASVPSILVVEVLATCVAVGVAVDEFVATQAVVVAVTCFDESVVVPEASGLGFEDGVAQVEVDDIAVVVVAPV